MAKLALINALRGPCPPDGFRYRDPVDGFISHAWDYSTWVEQMDKHLRVNNREVPPNLGEIMQEQLCMTLPPGWCNYDDSNRERASIITLNWEDVKEAAQRFAGWIKDGAPLVDQKEADRRALVCARCYLNVNISGCSACQAVVEALSSGLKTHHDQYLKSCAACKCNLKAKVHFPYETLDKENPRVQSLYPDHCWMKHGGINRK
jgi:hypothetical protein